jgi:hypothetical protein
MAAVVYLDVDQGSDFSAQITLQNDNGTPMNLTGFTAFSQFRKHPTSTTYYQFQPTITAPLTGVINLTLSAAASSLVKPGRYMYDVEITNGATRLRVSEGIVTINAEITKSS